MKVKFVPQNVEFEIKPGESVMHVAQDNGLYIKSVCKGVPSCAECRVRVLEGDYNVLPPGTEELSLIGTGHFIDRRRLSCQLKCFGDITVDLAEQVANQQELTSGKGPKSKAAVKDDRVEDTHVRTEGDFEEDNRAEKEARFDEEPAVGEGAEGPVVARPREQRRPDNRPRVGGAPGGGSGGAPGGVRPPQPKQDARPNQPPGPEGGEGGEQKKRRRRRGGRGRNSGGGGAGGAPSGGPGAGPSGNRPST